MLKVSTCLGNIAQQKMHSSTLNFDHLIPDMMRLPRRIFFASIFHFPLPPPPKPNLSRNTQARKGTEERERERGYKGGRKRLSLVRPIDIAGGRKGSLLSSPFQDATQKEGERRVSLPFFEKRPPLPFLKGGLVQGI